MPLILVVCLCDRERERVSVLVQSPVGNRILEGRIPDKHSETGLIANAAGNAQRHPENAL